MNILALFPFINIKTIAGVCTLIQTIVRIVKDILTVLINAALPFIPNAKVQKIRDLLNKIDGWLEVIKNYLFKLVK